MVTVFERYKDAVWGGSICTRVEPLEDGTSYRIWYFFPFDSPTHHNIAIIQPENDRYKVKWDDNRTEILTHDALFSAIDKKIQDLLKQQE
jgi:hypothetical protein